MRFKQFVGIRKFFLVVFVEFLFVFFVFLVVFFQLKFN